MLSRAVIFLIIGALAACAPPSAGPIVPPTAPMPLIGWDTSPLGPPHFLKAVEGVGVVNLSWSAPANDQGRIRAYIVKGNWGSDIVTSQTSVQIFLPEGIYSFSVIALLGDMETSNKKITQTPASLPIVAQSWGLPRKELTPPIEASISVLAAPLLRIPTSNIPSVIPTVACSKALWYVRLGICMDYGFYSDCNGRTDVGLGIKVFTCYQMGGPYILGHNSLPWGDIRKGVNGDEIHLNGRIYHVTGNYLAQTCTGIGVNYTWSALHLSTSSAGPCSKAFVLMAN